MYIYIICICVCVHIDIPCEAGTDRLLSLVEALQLAARGEIFESRFHKRQKPWRRLATLGDAALEISGNFRILTWSYIHSYVPKNVSHTSILWGIFPEI